MPDSFWPSALGVASSKRGQQLLQLVLVGAVAYAVPWLDGRASDADVAAVGVRVEVVRGLVVAEHEQPKRDGDGKVITLTQRVAALESQVMTLAQQLEASDRGRLALRADLVGVQAAMAEPRWQLRRQTAANARARFWAELGPADQPRSSDANYEREARAYRVALETRPPVR